MWSCRYREELKLLMAALPSKLAPPEEGRDGLVPYRPEDTESRQLPAISASFLAEAALAITNPTSPRGKLIIRYLKRGQLNLQVSTTSNLLFFFCENVKSNGPKGLIRISLRMLDLPTACNKIKLGYPGFRSPPMNKNEIASAECHRLILWASPNGICQMHDRKKCSVAVLV